MAARSAFILPPFCLTLLAACAPAVSPTPATPRPTATPAFDVVTPIEAAFQESGRPGEWQVVGLARDDHETLVDPHVEIVLRDASGAEARRTIALPSDPLPAGAGCPFLEIFRSPPSPTTVQATLLGDRGPSGNPGPIVTGKIVRTFLGARGIPTVLGSLTNPGARPLTVAGVRLVGRDAAGGLQAVVGADPGATWLEPGATTPFLARPLSTAQGLSWEVYTISAIGAGSPPEVEILDQVSARDAQGNPFVTATVLNPADRPVHLAMSAVASSDEGWLAADSIELPAPLAPGERASFSLRLPGGGLPPEIEWNLVAGATTSDVAAVVLPSEVVGYEPAGSTLLLRVRLTGRPGATVLVPSASAWLSDDAGEVVSAGWGSAAGPLTSSQAVVVTVALPLPDGLDLSLAEVDVRGVGVPAVGVTP